MPVDGQLVARTVAELRAMPEADALLVRLERVVEATRTVVGADGTGLTLVHEDGLPRWVAVSDAAMQLLEEVQHDFGEGPCVAAYAEDRVVAVQDLAGEQVWDRIAVVVRQLQVRGVLSVPVRLGDQPVGTLNVYASQPRAWSPAEVQALGALALVTAELVHTAVELANRQVEVGQLRQALASRVWIEQAKGMLAATQGVSLDQAFQRLRRRARASSRKLAEVALEVVQDAQRERIAAKALDDARVGRPRRGPGRPSKHSRRPRRGWLDAKRPWTGPRTISLCVSGPLTSGTTSRMSATGRRMTATILPMPASGPLMCESGSPTSASGPPTNVTATGPPTNATVPPTSATRPATTPSSLIGSRSGAKDTGRQHPNGSTSHVLTFEAERGHKPHGGWRSSAPPESRGP
jgi:GAF domain-containing protein